MAVRRTLKDKQHAEQSRLKSTSGSMTSDGAYSLERTSRPTKIQVKATSPSSLLKIDQHYIAQDLVKTLLISGFLFSLLIGIYFYLGYN